MDAPNKLPAMLSGLKLAIDVYYRDEHAKAVGLLFRDWAEGLTRPAAIPPQKIFLYEHIIFTYFAIPNLSLCLSLISKPFNKRMRALHPTFTAHP